jgi:serine/threonine-protein kinase
MALSADIDAGSSAAPGAPKGGERARFQPDSLLGATLDGRYRLLAHLASGGMGAVYRAEHVFMRKEVALKVLRPDLTASPDIAERFRRESEIAASLDHENVVRVTDFGKTPEGHLFIAMELLEGESLFDRLQRTGPMAPAEAVPILLQVCAALEAFHGRGIVHRDLKPENIFLHSPPGAAPVVKVLDFGIAKVSDPRNPSTTDLGMVVGTPEYLSPEQAFGREVDARADVYAVGIVAWRMLAGQHPFEADSPRALVMKQATEPVPPLQGVRPDLAGHPALVAAVARACSKDPACRQASAVALAAELARAAGIPTPFALPALPPAGGGTPARVGVLPESLTVSLPTPLPAVAIPRRRWQRRAAAAAGALALAVAAVSGVGLWQRALGVRRAEGLLAERRHAEARDLLAAELARRPGEPRLRALLGRAQAGMGQAAAGLESLDIATRSDPSSLDAESLRWVAAQLAGEPGASERAARILARAGSRSAGAVVAEVPRTSGVQRLRALELLRAVGAEERIDRVAAWEPLLVEADCDLRRAAARRLGEIGSPAAVPRLRALAGITRGEPVCGAREAEEALERIRLAADGPQP